MISWAAILSSTKRGLLVRVAGVGEEDDRAGVVAEAALAVAAEDDRAGVAAEAAGAEAGTVTAVIAAVEAAETAAGNRAINLRNLCIEPGSIFRSPFFFAILSQSDQPQENIYPRRKMHEWQLPTDAIHSK
jgi:hypothetical protein